MIPKDFSEEVFRNSKNKDGLVSYDLVVAFMEFHKISQVLVVNIKDTIPSNKTDIATESFIFHSNIEEEDSQLISHSINLCQHGYKKVIINTVDTYVLILAIAYSHKLAEYGVDSYIVKVELRDNAKFHNILQLRDTRRIFRSFHIVK